MQYLLLFELVIEMQVTWVNRKACFLHTLDGVKDAWAYPTHKDNWGRSVSKIQTQDGKFTIHVFSGVYEGKFESEEKPTFYAC